jgi:hypothetical protein
LTCSTAAPLSRLRCRCPWPATRAPGECYNFAARFTGNYLGGALRAAARGGGGGGGADLEVVAARVEQVADLLVVHLDEGALGAVSATRRYNRASVVIGTLPRGNNRRVHGTAMLWPRATHSTLSSVLALILSNMKVQARGTTPHNCDKKTKPMRRYHKHTNKRQTKP